MELSGFQVDVASGEYQGVLVIILYTYREFQMLRMTVGLPWQASLFWDRPESGVVHQVTPPTPPRDNVRPSSLIFMHQRIDMYTFRRSIPRSADAQEASYRGNGDDEA